MNRIEDEVRELLHSKVAQARVSEVPPPVVLRRVRVLRIINGVGATAGAAAIVLGIVLAAKSLGGQQITVPSGPGPILWSPALAQGVVQRPDAIALDLKPCRSDQVQPQWIRPPPLQGFGFLLNGDVECLIDARAGFAVSIRDAEGGQPLPVEVRITDTVPGLLLRRSPGMPGLGFTWSNYCGPRPKEIAFDFTLPTGGTITAGALGEYLPSCADAAAASTLTIESLVWFDLTDHSLSPLINLIAAIQAPEQAARGTTLSFQVTLENPLDQAVALDPCPNYEEGLENQLGATGAYYGLNCDAAPSVIPAGGSLAFQMRFDVPANVEPGVWRLYWFLLSGGNIATSMIHIS